MRLHQLSNTSKVILFLMVDSTDHVTAKTGLTLTVTRSKNGGAFAAATGSVAEIANGWYALTPASGDVDTLGPTVFRATGTAADPYDVEYQIVAFDPYDAADLGLTNLDQAISAILACDGKTQRQVAQILVAAAAGERVGDNLRDLTDTVNRLAFTSNRATVTIDDTPTP